MPEKDGKFTDEQRRARQRQLAIERWQDPDYRERVLAKLNSPEAVAAKREQAIRQWQDPAHRERMSQPRNLTEAGRGRLISNMTERWEDEEWRAKMAEVNATRGGGSEMMLRRWQDPVYRAHMLEELCGRWRDPEYRERLAEYRRSWWRDPANRMRMVKAPTPSRYRLNAPVKGVCVYCGGLATEHDHAQPRVRGGTDDAENLVLSCLFCNSSKGARTAEEFELWQAAGRPKGLYPTIPMRIYEVLPGLMQRGHTLKQERERIELTLEIAGIVNVVNLANQPDRRVARMVDRYIHCHLPDGKNCSYPLAEAVADEVAAAVNNGEGTLVHCYGGRNRASLITALTYRKLKGVSGPEAIEAVRQARPNALTNAFFVAYLDTLSTCDPLRG